MYKKLWKLFKVNWSASKLCATDNTRWTKQTASKTTMLVPYWIRGAHSETATSVWLTKKDYYRTNTVCVCQATVPILQNRTMEGAPPPPHYISRNYETRIIERTRQKKVRWKQKQQQREMIGIFSAIDNIFSLESGIKYLLLCIPFKHRVARLFSF